MVKALVLDFGGVLYEIDYDLTRLALAKLSDNSQIFNQMSHNEFFDFPVLFEKGKISSSEFRIHINQLINSNRNDHIIDEAWNAMLLSLKPDAYDFVKELRKYLPVYLFSNTNEIHYNGFAPECSTLFTLFEHCFFSHLIGERKPEKKSFLYISDTLRIKPSEILFVDDTIQNIQSANELGFKTYHHFRNSGLSELLHTIKNILHFNKNIYNH